MVLSVDTDTFRWDCRPWKIPHCKWQDGRFEPEDKDHASPCLWHCG